MDFVAITIDILNFLAKIVGSHGWAIIIFTVIMRLFLWPMNVSQQRSMRNMQLLTPKMKQIQEKYKNNPQMMQQKMMEFYKEHNFNPTAGCLPMLIQIPIFIMLYTALMSPQFIQLAGNSKFFFIDRLDSTMKSNAGISNDGKFALSKNPVLFAGKDAKVYLDDGTTNVVKIIKPQKAIQIAGYTNNEQSIKLNMPLDNLANLGFTGQNKVQKAELSVINPTTKETELVTFTRDNDKISALVEISPVEEKLHYDVLLLIALFGLTIWLSQKVMMATTQTKNQDATQAAIQKSMGTIMPIMIILTFVFIPIPAGALLYLVTSNIFQIAQTVIINKQLEIEDKKKELGVNDENKIIDAKVIESKTIDNKEK